jgi:UDP-N-acetylglucosamine diphosphorylase/glucosamine-1-phosphate N-acetyltransferase
LVGGRIRSGCSFGPVCRIGGEVEQSIFLGHDNKYHDGFLGHAYVGQWVNLGALTTNSDLKNNYGTVRVEVGGQEIDTGLLKVGSFIGDHVRTGIGTLLNTGISVGFCSNLFGGGMFAQKSIPPFSWGTVGKIDEYQVDQALLTAEQVQRRREVAFSPAQKRLFLELFELSRSVKRR